MTLTAPVKWAQRKNSVFVTIDVPDVDEKTAKIDVAEKKLTFSGKSGDKDYHVELEFLHEIDPAAEDTKYSIKPRNIAFHLVKKEEESWSRLLENHALQKTNVKCDFDKWVDSDEEEGGEGFNMDGMQGMPGGMGGMPGGMGGMPGMGGMGGMPGMGGMGGMPGMEGMDMAKLMEQMKGMGGMPGMDGAEGGEAGEDSDDDELPELEEVPEDTPTVE